MLHFARNHWSAAVLVSALVFALASPAEAHDGHEQEVISDEMAAAANALLDSLSVEPGQIENLYNYSQQQSIRADLDAAQRQNWSYWPRARVGLMLSQMTADQRLLAHRLLATTLSPAGHLKVAHIMRLEDFLRPADAAGFLRHPDDYGFIVFGNPSATAPWAWRYEGHHVSINVTVVGNEVRLTPSFLGVSPSVIPTGPLAGFRVLRDEEGLAGRLVRSLDGVEAQRAILADAPPAEILSSQFLKDRGEWDAWKSLMQRDGLPVADMTDDQRALVARLLDEIFGTYRQGLTQFYRDNLSIDELSFAWLGGTEAGAPHYYRIQGADFVFEYDNAQEGGRHIHTVWRDRTRDFGEDLLARHYRREAH